MHKHAQLIYTYYNIYNSDCVRLYTTRSNTRYDARPIHIDKTIKMQQDCLPSPAILPPSHSNGIAMDVVDAIGKVHVYGHPANIRAHTMPANAFVWVHTNWKSDGELRAKSTSVWVTDWVLYNGIIRCSSVHQLAQLAMHSTHHQTCECVQSPNQYLIGCETNTHSTTVQHNAFDFIT